MSDKPDTNTTSGDPSDCERQVVSTDLRLMMAEACLEEIRSLLPKEWEDSEISYCVLQLVKQRRMLKELHAWFLEKDPDNYKWCGLYHEVLGSLNC